MLSRLSFGNNVRPFLSLCSCIFVFVQLYLCLCAVVFLSLCSCIFVRGRLIGTWAMRQFPWWGKPPSSWAAPPISGQLSSQTFQGRDVFYFEIGDHLRHFSSIDNQARLGKRRWCKFSQVEDKEAAECLMCGHLDIIVGARSRENSRHSHPPTCWVPPSNCTWRTLDKYNLDRTRCGKKLQSNAMDCFTKDLILFKTKDILKMANWIFCNSFITTWQQHVSGGVFFWKPDDCRWQMS